MAEETAAPIASGERTDPTVSVMVDEKPPQPENENVTESLFGETVSEAELRGEEGPVTPPPASEAKPIEASASPPLEGEKPTATPPPASEEPKTPPPGFVPLAALHEERGKRQAMSQRMQELESENASLKSGRPAAITPPVKEEPAAPQPKSELPPDFKVLSSQEFKELAETDLVEAQIYQYNLRTYEKEQAAAKDITEKQSRVQEKIQEIIETRYGEMEKAVPGIFDENSTINQDLTAFAESHGLDPVYVGILTDPATRFVQDGKVQVLGKGAVQILSMLHNLYQGLKPDPSKAEALRAQGAAEALNKITNNSAGFRGIGDTPPGGSSIPSDPNRVLSEKELAALPEAEQQRYLSGA